MRGESGKAYLGPVVVIGAVSVSIILAFFFPPEPTHPQISRTLGVAVLMAILWVSEVVPLAVTSLLPVVLFPPLGIMAGRRVAATYFNSVIFLFIGGFLMAIAMQRWNLHRRIALRIIMLVGSGYRRLLLGFMIATAFLSMWISNTATVMMMVPIAMAVISNMEERSGRRKEIKRFSVGLLLAIAYSASIGGIATLIGTPPNAILVKIYNISFPTASEISFASWFLFAFPITLLLLLFSWLLIVIMYCPRKVYSAPEEEVFIDEYRKLGPMSFEEKVILFLFSLLGLMWLTRSPVHIGAFYIPGWSSMMPYPKYIDDGTVAMMVSILLFFIPSKKEGWYPIMDWEAAKELPWDIVLLFGGGFALALGFKDSGLALWIGHKISGFHYLPMPFMIMLMIAGMEILTEFTSNTASTQMILPILAGIASSFKIPPLLLMIPATIAASCAFILPVATPPNAIIFGTKRITVLQMATTGIFIDLVAIFLISGALYTVGSRIFFF